MTDFVALLGAATGTVAIGSGSGWSLTVVRAGDVIDHTDIGQAPPSRAVDQAFVFHEHAVVNDPPERASDPEGSGPRDVPALPSLFPAARWPGLVCIPHGPGLVDLPAGLVSLPSLAAHLGETGFRGVLAAQGGPGFAAAVMIDGRFVAATGERVGHELHGPNALRLLARHAIEVAAPPLRLLPLPASLLAAVAGTILDRRGDDGAGVQVGESTAVMTGTEGAWLRVAYASAERLGRFAFEPALDTVAAIALPEEPLDWETRTYQLTLRGRDVLDPMTEVAMRFGAEHGKTGKRLLDALRRGLDAEAVAAELDLELDEVGVRLRRLQSEGFVRVQG